ncbi:hypothetical protein [Terrihabitans sp. B22-R8]|uniref:hypothetical protein n=1 Tax=Terrihabitans sp. B22-R8 TaxID=3425128 RepID=UPI00403CDBE5
MPRTITITAMARPELLRDMLLSLRENDLTGWKIFVAVEPSPAAQDIVELCRTLLSSADLDLRVNERVLGIQANPYHVQKRAFDSGSSLNVYLEEDLRLAPDALALAMWFERHHQPHWLCLNLMAGPCESAGYLSDPAWPAEVFESRTFNSLGFAARQEEWRSLIAPVWHPDVKPRRRLGGRAANWRTRLGWDWSIFGLLASRPELRSVQPVLARSTHTGAMGTYCRPDFQKRAFDDLPVAQVPQADFVLREIAQLPRGVRSHIFLQQEQTDLRMMAEAAGRGRVLSGMDAWLQRRFGRTLPF